MSRVTEGDNKKLSGKYISVFVNVLFGVKILCCERKVMNGGQSQFQREEGVGGISCSTAEDFHRYKQGERGAMTLEHWNQC